MLTILRSKKETRPPHDQSQTQTRSKPWGTLLIFFVCHTTVFANPKDEICFPSYRHGGAMPGVEGCSALAKHSCADGTRLFCTKDTDRINRYCRQVPKDINQCPRMVGNPIDSGTGNKHLAETDYQGTGTMPLMFTRYYNSSPAVVQNGTLGSYWRSNFDRRITVVSWSIIADVRPDGTFTYFKRQGETWLPDSDIADRLVELLDSDGHRSGWEVTRAKDESVESYSMDGRLMKVVSRNGQALSLIWKTPAIWYDRVEANDLLQVVDPFGRALTFKWNPQGNLEELIDPAGNVYSYQYDSDGRLTSVTFPGNPASVRAYVYNEPAFTSGENLPNAVTGVIDENGVRFATYRYDNLGRGVATEHAGNTNKYELSYSPGQTTVTDPLGTARIYRFVPVQGTLKVAGVDQPGGEGCSAAASATTYDVNGNVATRVDFNGNKVAFGYDLARNLETSRQEAVGTVNTRLTSTMWHQTLRLPIKIAEPLRLFLFDYDARGNLLSKTEQATGDANGTQGFAASLVGSPRIWRYTYNDAGQILSSTGPRNDLTATTRYTYDANSNLSTITNALGHTTSLSNYDVHGNVGRITYPNGRTADFAYNLRSRLLGISTEGETTSYAYDAAGQRVRSTLAGGPTITYSYDAAHRLTALQDTVGNSVRWVLDAMGNPVSETVNAEDGGVVRQITRVYDPLNRIKQITGGDQ